MRYRFLLVVDLLLISVATVSALILRDNLEISLERVLVVLPYLGITLLVTVPVLGVLELDRAVWRLSSLGDYLRVVVAVCIIVLSAVAVGFAVNRLEGVARSLPVLQALLMSCTLVAVRVIVRLRHANRTRRPLPKTVMSDPLETILVVGLSSITELFLRSVAEFSSERLKIAGILGKHERHNGLLVMGHRVLGAPEDIYSILQNLEVHGVAVDRIVITVPFESLSPTTRRAILQIEQHSKIRCVYLAETLGLSETSTTASTELAARDQAVFSISQEEADRLLHRPYWRVKRVLDKLLALLAIVLLAPLIITLGCCVAADAGMPVVFWQQRPGARRRAFKLYKFRTMGASHDGLGRRIADDNRVSRFGDLLRRTRLDELPQLFNILKGEMSFVGPRPLLPVDQPEEFSARLLLCPGLTGFAQVSGGRDISPADKAALDVWYLHHASLVLDLKIVLQTVPLILHGERTQSEVIQRAWHDLWRAGVCSSPGERRVEKRAA